jgi:hypothetical protein
MAAMTFNYQKLTKRDGEDAALLIRALRREIDGRPDKAKE